MIRQGPPGQALRAIASEAWKLTAYLERLKNIFEGKSKRQLTIDRLKAGLIRGRLILEGIKKIRFKGLVPEYSVMGLERFFLVLRFWFHKRKLLRCCKRLRFSLKKSMKLFTKRRFNRAYKWLGLAALYGSNLVRALNKLEGRINTALDTDKTVQIQIQKGRKRM